MIALKVFVSFFVTIARIRVCVKLVKTIYINKAIKEVYITKDKSFPSADYMGLAGLMQPQPFQ